MSKSAADEAYEDAMRLTMSKTTRPIEIDADELVDSLLSARNMIDLTILAAENFEFDLIPTGIETAFEKLQDMVYNYCVKED